MATFFLSLSNLGLVDAIIRFAFIYGTFTIATFFIALFLLVQEAKAHGRTFFESLKERAFFLMFLACFYLPLIFLDSLMIRFISACRGFFVNGLR